jgi:hypothetical protein
MKYEKIKPLMTWALKQNQYGTSIQAIYWKFLVNYCYPQFVHSTSLTIPFSLNIYIYNHVQKKDTI